MAAPPTNPGQRAKHGTFGPWVAIAVVAILAGLVLPQMMPGETVVSKSVRTEDKDKTNLQYTAAPLPEPPNFQALMLRLGVGTFLVLALCVATLWGMRRWMNPSTSPSSGDATMRLLETLPLGNRCCLHLVQLGKREVLVGIDSGGIKSVLPLAEPFDEILAHAQETPVVAVAQDSRPLAA